MTILGSHTMAETEDLMKTVEFRIKAGDKVNSTITQAQLEADPAGITDLQNDWSKFKFRWATAREKVLNALLLRKLAQPLAAASLIPTEDEYKTVRSAINVGGADTFTKGDLTDCLNRIEKATGTRIDEKDAPAPTGFDPDLAAYKKVDDVIKSGEAAAASAAAGAGNVVKSNPTPFIIAGLAAAVGLGIAAKIYLPAPRR